MASLFLIRHGLAGEHGSYANDAERPLTREGQQKTRQVAKRLRKLDLTFDRLLTSPLVRARQTAEILLEAGLAEQLEEVAYLAPGGDLQAWAEAWQTGTFGPIASLALVGHEPDLSTWAEILLWGQSQGIFTLKKAGIIGLSLPQAGSPIGQSQLFWLTPPRYLLD